MAKIIVDTGDLVNAASYIEEEANAFQDTYAVDFKQDVMGVMHASWEGVDYQAYEVELDEFVSQYLSRAYAEFGRYVQFLRDAARAYEQAQDDALDNARRLIQQ